LCFLLGWAAVSGPLCTIACTSDYLRLKTTITGIEREGDRITRIITDQGAVSGDQFVLALGLHRATIGLDLPIYPIRYRPTDIPRRRQSASSRRTISSLFARLGNHLRAGGKAEFAGYDKSYSTEFPANSAKAACASQPCNAPTAVGDHRYIDAVSGWLRS